MAWTFGGGVFVAPLASVELEVMGTGTFRSRQQPRSAVGRITIDEHKRDRAFNLNLRLHLSRWRHVQFNPLGGVGFIQHWGWSQNIAVNHVPVVRPRQRRNLPTDVGVTLGFDVRVGGEHFAVVPSFRFWRRGGDIRSRDEQYQQYDSGPSQWMSSPGLVARINF